MNRHRLTPEEAARIAAEHILHIQRRTAQILNSCTRSASGRQKKIGLLLLILAMGGYSLYLLLHAFKS